MNKNHTYISFWVKRFLLEYIINVKNLSRNTQISYRDTFRLLLPEIAKMAKSNIENLHVEEISPECVKRFLNDIESVRNCSISTRNQRLAAIHAFASFVCQCCPEYVEWARQIKNIPFKRGGKKQITYLEKEEMNAILDSPDRKVPQGFRDYALLLFLYNTGARADEVAKLSISDLSLEKGLATVVLHGKGKKDRRCPLWDQTVKALKPLIFGRDMVEPVFLNRLSQPITRFGIYSLVERHAKKVSLIMPEINEKRVSPHTIRHTTATHLLQSGVDLNTIRVWLGHVSIDTTNIYAEVNMKMKAEALECCEVRTAKIITPWRNNKTLMEFLDNL
ncbi:site-specific integrase [Alistipes sp. OttesenSCG-928-L06]|nr:site-specific integrase [Alistipes sp. OttesenSCG-928-L06]